MTNDATNINLPALPDDFNADWADQYIEDEGGPEAEFLRFNSKEGIWVHGRENTEMPCGTRFLALMPFMRKGRIKFNGPGNEPDKVVVLAASSQKVDRASLGDTDETKWPVVNGKPQDPWQEYREIDLYDLASSQQYTLTAASIGGVQAVKRLVDSYRNGQHKHPDQLPVIELQKGSYVHTILGHTVNVPKTPVVGWQTNSPGAKESGDDPELDDSIPF
jgi:hypothetical protein